jgi:hypothetical protein
MRYRRFARIIWGALFYVAVLAAALPLERCASRSARAIATHDGFAARCDPATGNAATDYCAELYGARRTQ